MSLHAMAYLCAATCPFLSVQQFVHLYFGHWWIATDRHIRLL